MTTLPPVFFRPNSVRSSQEELADIYDRFDDDYYPSFNEDEADE